MLFLKMVYHRFCFVSESEKKKKSNSNIKWKFFISNYHWLTHYTMQCFNLNFLHCYGIYPMLTLTRNVYSFILNYWSTNNESSKKTVFSMLNDWGKKSFFFLYIICKLNMRWRNYSKSFIYKLYSKSFIWELRLN